MDRIVFKQVPETRQGIGSVLEGHITFLRGTCNSKQFLIGAEDNAAESVTVWVAEKPRTAVIEVTSPDYELDSRYIPVFTS